jgi:hypothetical protein
LLDGRKIPVINLRRQSDNRQFSIAYAARKEPNAENHGGIGLTWQPYPPFRSMIGMIFLGRAIGRR